MTRRVWSISTTFYKLQSVPWYTVLVTSFCYENVSNFFERFISFANDYVLSHETYNAKEFVSCSRTRARFTDNRGIYFYDENVKLIENTRLIRKSKRKTFAKTRFILILLQLFHALNYSPIQQLPIKCHANSNWARWHSELHPTMEVYCNSEN